MYTVLEEKGIRAYLEKRGLLKRYKEKKELFKKGKIQQITLKKDNQNHRGSTNFESPKNIVPMAISSIPMFLL